MIKILTDSPEEYKNVKFNKLILIGFLMSILLMPLDDLPYFKNVLGELSVRGSIYPIIIVIILTGIYIIKSKKLFLKFTVEKKVLFIFFTWVIISAMVNFTSIMQNNFKGRNGLEKIILQLMVLGFVCFIYYISEFAVVINKLKLETIRKYVFISFLVVCSYALLELVNIYGLMNTSTFLIESSKFIQSNISGFLYGDRVRSITGEASYLGMYMAFAYPWVLSYIYTEKKNYKKIIYIILNVFAIFMVYSTKSRVAYAILMGEIGLAVVLFLVFNKNIRNKVLTVIIALVSIGTIAISDNIATSLKKISPNVNHEEKKDDQYNFNMSINGVVESLSSETNYSNIARLGLQKSAIAIGNDKPIFGVGLGQFGFYADSYLAEETRISHEIQQWTNPEGGPWPPAFALYPRIIAEQGYIGIIIWLIMLIIVSLKFLKFIISKKDNVLEILVLVSFAGVVVSSLNADTYALPQFWILMGIISAYSNFQID